MDITKSRSQLKNFFSDSSSHAYKRHDIVLSHNEANPQAYWIESGYIKVVGYSNKGAERLNYIYGPGEIFPLAGIFNHAIGIQTFQAVSTVSLKKRTVKDFTRYVEANGGSLAIVVNQMLAFIDRIYTLNIAPAEERIMYALIFLAERFGTKEEEHMVIDLALTQQEFGDMLRLTREFVGIKMRELEDQNVLVTSRRQIRVYPDRLRKLIEKL